ncbi:MAG: bifunctional isocitrate dehydrogenase kinase/phosphatase [Gammaproteobacteria bacterium]|nr:bifunctional isocitrate dehydrogenase kinase/phosphatase [Gammaproteobacteria bacterium]
MCYDEALNFMRNSSTNSTPEEVAKRILGGFNQHYENIKSASIKAKECFEKRQWDQIEKESKSRLNFYDKQVDLYCAELKACLGQREREPTFWKSVKRYYVDLINNHQQPELAETFFNSVFCHLFERSFYNNQYIFTRPSVSITHIDMEEPVVDSYIVRSGTFKHIFSQILASYSFACEFEDLERDISRLEEQLYQQIDYLKSDIFEIQVINSTFIRGKGAYIVGNIVTELHANRPILIALLNEEKRGLFVDSLLLETKSIGSIFSFSRSYFFITTDYPSAVVEYLKTTILGKTRADLYSLIGLHKHGKTLLYRHFLRYSKITKEKLMIAPGIKGMVMSVFTFPMFPFVFKMINDHFTPPKMGTRKMVQDKYYFVKNHVRIGRLADTWEFSDVAFPLKDIDDALLNELQTKAPANIEIEGDLLVIKHMYIENKMTPLNLYLETATDDQKEHIINDYGQAIDELINSNIFPGDMLTKNFGVTRQNRVVFYDYDEITLMSKPNFRKIPEPTTHEQEMASKPWYYVGPDDVFPEEFKYFMFPSPKMKGIFSRNYQKLLDADYWCSIQQRIEEKGVIDYYPYGQEKRMCNIYGENNE